MRVGLVIYGSLSARSGGYLYDQHLVNFLRSQGDTVEVISLPWRNYPRHCLDNFDPELYQTLKGLAVDILLEDELNHPSLFLVNARLQQPNSPVLVSIVHHLRTSELHPRFFTGLYRQVERSYLRSVDAFIFNSQTTRRTVETLLGKPAEGVLAYPAGDELGDVPTLEQLELKNFNGPLQLVFVGNVIPRKGLHTLLEALSRLADNNWCLHIIGEETDPGYAARVHQLAGPLGERVHFLGRLDGALLREEFKRGHVLVVPSSYEGFGIVYLEAMAFGLPAVATTAGAAWEIIQDRTNGYLVPAEQPEALAAVLRQLIGNSASLAHMSRAARTRFDDFPRWDETCATIRGFLVSLLERKV